MANNNNNVYQDVEIIIPKYSSKIIKRSIFGQVMTLTIVSMILINCFLPFQIFNPKLTNSLAYNLEIEAKEATKSVQTSQVTSSVSDVLNALMNSKNESIKQSAFTDKVKVTKNNQSQLTELTNQYFSKYFANSPVKPAELVQLALDYNFPLDFLLVSGHLESHFCTKGRGADSNNCHNVNNTDLGDDKITKCGEYTECLSNTLTGEIKFINLIKNCYFELNENITLQDFIDSDFRIKRTVKPFCSAKIGSRYMTDIESRHKYIYAINNWINPIFGGYQKE